MRKLKNKKYLISIFCLILIFGFLFATIQDDDAKKPEVKKKKMEKNKKPNTKNNKKPKITFVGKPSCKSCYRQKYIWRKQTFINYCPNCKHYETLKINPKRVPERELTCSKCSSDFCICGHDKTSTKRHYNSILKKA